MNIINYPPPPPPKQISKSNIKKPKGIKRIGEKFGLKNFPLKIAIDWQYALCVYLICIMLGGLNNRKK
jgi:hypothetical protein